MLNASVIIQCHCLIFLIWQVTKMQVTTSDEWWPIVKYSGDIISQNQMINSIILIKCFIFFISIGKQKRKRWQHKKKFKKPKPKATNLNVLVADKIVGMLLFFSVFSGYFSLNIPSKIELLI